ncbi:UDP-glucose dehydrogenase family protein, partial [Auraticoccus cholistanensis]|uniref:UDP-glucose dehydrogenase family protein n=1 Tax=Auraticoccus cholistanensis TaxID=2656650 RepID=UPI001E612B02
TEIADWADVHFICVGTPQQPSGAADLSQVESVVETLAPLLTRPTLVVGKSTVPVGTAPALRDRLHELAPAGEQVELAWNPEFLREAFAVEDTLRPDRIVLGTESPRALALLHRLYAIPISEETPLVECDLATAELIKVAANAFLATKISFINAMAQMCQAAGGDVELLADALGHDKRIGRAFLNAGLGFGGGCLPKDIRALSARASELGVDVLADLIGSVESINNNQRKEVAELAIEQLGGDVHGCKIAVLGAAFKPGTDDTRNSPALDVAHFLADAGADVHVFDPHARVTRPDLTQAETIPDLFRGAHLVLHLTEWPEFRYLEPAELSPLVANKVLIDARLKLHRPTWQQAGWRVVQLGRAATL